MDASTEDISARVRNEQHGQTETWLKPHATHDVVRVHDMRDPVGLRFDCYTCRLTFIATISTYIDWRGEPTSYTVDVTGRETPLLG